MRGLGPAAGRAALSLGVWCLLALLVTWPLILHPAGNLLGSPMIDVWNHAWGYWYVADALGRGELPYHTELVGAPDGGVLWFIDFVGALWALPLTWTVGPAVGFNLVQIGRVAMAGVAGQLLALELFGDRRTAWLAGAAAATTPFVLSELYNGITEVCAVSGVGFTLCAAVRVVRRRSLGSWAVLGLAGGLTAATTFYYGLVVAILVAAWLAWSLLRRDLPLDRRLPLGLVLAGGVALALAGPVWHAFSSSLSAPGAFVTRATSDAPEIGLMVHNAVDPRTYVAPGGFQSVYLYDSFKEYFIHSGYLRWTLLVPACFAVIWLPKARVWAALALASMVMGLGDQLFWDAHFVEPGGSRVWLPFSQLRLLLPEVTISHPLRLSVGAQVLVPVLAAGGLGAALEGVERVAWRRLAVGLLAALAVSESLFASAAVWPLPLSPAEVPDVYQALPEGPVLDLPVLHDTGMSTQRYFWYQTRHHHPVPWPLDIRLQRKRDDLVDETFRYYPMDRRLGREIPDNLAIYLCDTFAGIVVHSQLEPEKRVGAHRSMIQPKLDSPDEVGGSLVWVLDERRCARWMEDGKRPSGAGGP